jgi:hypothetical protein
MNDKDIGWLAGVLDGEGCIHASKPWKPEHDRKSNGRFHFDIRVIITNGSTLLMEKVGQLLRSEGIEYKYRDGCSKHTAEIVIAKKSEILKLLHLLVNDLTRTKRSAEYVISYIQKYGYSNNIYGVKGASEENVKDYIKLYNVLKKQKRKCLESVETICYTSNVDEDIVRHSK